MPSKHKSAAKIARGINRAMQYKKEILIDLYDLDVEVNLKTQELQWKATDDITLTLKPQCEILETRYIFNPVFSTYTLGQRVSNFQNMWKPDNNNFILFTCLLNHLKENTYSCDKLCGHLAVQQICGHLLRTLSEAGSRPPD